ncbi:MAG: HAD-IC family P-type ATPase [Oligoflexia bacterium]|nr:HAD-IC family P-type ATPase [Oligoflexia bacterium]
MDASKIHVCRHCGVECNSESDFCCSGCSVAFQLITDSGFNEFYSKLSNKKLNTFLQSSYDHLELEFNSQLQPKAINKNISQITLFIENVTCNACSWLLEKIPGINQNITAVSYSPSVSQITVQYLKDYPLIEVAKTFYNLGYPVHVATQDIKVKKLMRQFYTQVAVAFASMISIMHVNLTLLAGVLEGMDTGTIRSLGLICLLLSLPIILYSATSFYKNTWLSFKTKQVHIDILVTLTITVTLFAGIYNIITAKNEFYFDAMATLVAFILGARLLVKEMENRFYLKSSASVLDLINNNFNIKVGQIINVKSGSPFPCDGIILSGSSFVDSSWLTGESAPQYVFKDMKVFAGSINKGDLVTIQATEVGVNTRAAKIQSLLNSTVKSDTEIKTQGYEKVFVGTTIISLLTLSIVNAFFPIIDWSKIVALVIILCPCALGLAIPLTFSAAIKQALNKGIYFKSAQALEKANSIETIIFDKTGTLTKSEFTLSKTNWDEEATKKLNLEKSTIESILYVIAQRSNHLLLRPFLKFKLNNFNYNLVTSFQEHFSKGVELTYLSVTFKIGNQSFVNANKILEGSSTKLYLSANNILIAVFEFEEQIDPNLIKSVKELSKSKNIYLLSGDSEESVNKVAKIFDIPKTNTFSRQSPEDKLNFIEKLSERHNILMIGDGVNDLLAIKKSHLSISIFEEKSSAMNQSDILLQQKNLVLLPQIFKAAKKVHDVVLINLGWTVIFNILGIFLVLAGIIGPIACALLMPLSSAIVVLFSVKQRYFV